MIGTEWTLIDEDGQTAVSMTSFIDIDLRNEGQALSYPVEKGSFTDFNKVQGPLEIRATLGKQGDPSEIEDLLNRLNEFQREAVKLAVATPDTLYGSMTLESYSYKRTSESNATMLTVELTLKEVREVETQVKTTASESSISKPKNPTSEGKTNIGKTQAEEVPAEKEKQRSTLADIF